MNPAGEIVIPLRFDEVRPFSEGVAAVRVGSKWGAVDKSGTLVVEARFADAPRFSDGRAAVRRGTKYVYIDPTGKIVLDGGYDAAGPFRGGLAYVQHLRNSPEQREGYIDRTGQWVFWQGNGYPTGRSIRRGK